MKEELKTCPFCGSEAEITQIGNAATKSRKAKIKCTNAFCSAEIIKATLRHDMDWVVRLVTSYWNTRTTTDRDSILEKCVEAVKSVAGERVLYSSGESMIGRINIAALRTALRTVLNPE